MTDKDKVPEGHEVKHDMFDLPHRRPQRVLKIQ